MKYTQFAKLILGTFMVLSSVEIYAFTVGIVDYDKILNLTSEGKQIKQIIEQEMEKGEAELKALHESILELNQNYEKTKSLLSEEGKYKKEQEIIEKSTDFQAKQYELQELIMRKEMELQSPFQEKIKGIVEAVALKANVDVTISSQKNPFEHIKKSVDLTNEIITEFEKSIQKNKIQTSKK